MSDINILIEEYNKIFTKENLETLEKEMDKINPRQMCILCGEPCQKIHILCPSCYARESMRIEGDKSE